MIHSIVKTEKVTVSASAATTLHVGFAAFLIKNNSTGATVYFCGDGQNDSAENGFALLPGETLAVPLRCEVLSLSASAAADVRLLYIGEGW